MYASNPLLRSILNRKISIQSDSQVHLQDRVCITGFSVATIKERKGLFKIFADVLIQNKKFCIHMQPSLTLEQRGEVSCARILAPGTEITPLIYFRPTQALSVPEIEDLCKKEPVLTLFICSLY